MLRSPAFYEDFELVPPTSELRTCTGCAFFKPCLSDECTTAPDCAVDDKPMIFVRKVPQ